MSGKRMAVPLLSGVRRFSWSPWRPLDASVLEEAYSFAVGGFCRRSFLRGLGCRAGSEAEFLFGRCGVTALGLLDEFQQFVLPSGVHVVPGRHFVSEPQFCGDECSDGVAWRRF
jgi:hypothetical protein